MAPAAEDAAAPVARRGGGRRRLSWVISVLCSGGRGGEEALAAGGTPWARLRRRKRTVPVDGEPVADREVMGRGAEEQEEARKGRRLCGCCFLPPPARTPGRKHSAVGSSSIHDKQRRLQGHTQQRPPSRAQDGKNSSPVAPPARRFQATASDGAARPRRAEPLCAAPPGKRPPTQTPPATPRDTGDKSEAPAGGCHGEKAGVGASSFGPAVGLCLCVVAAVSMAGLLGGRLCAVACVCAWTLALSKLQRRKAPAAGRGGTAERRERRRRGSGAC